MSPWNYPLLLTLDPLVDALAAGNTAVIKPSAYSPHTSEVMQEEIFGPVLPILTYESMDQAIAKINAGAHPLALYIFTSDQAVQKKVMECCKFGGGCVNDVVIHLATSEMGFGGFGESGMGSYHGKDGFQTFSHVKSIVDKKTWIDLPMRYQPYTKLYDRMIRLFVK